MLICQTAGGARPSSFVLIGLMTLSACVAPNNAGPVPRLPSNVTTGNVAPSGRYVAFNSQGKTPRAFSNDGAYCNTTANSELDYAQCMLNRGDIIIDPTGHYYGPYSRLSPQSVAATVPPNPSLSEGQRLHLDTKHYPLPPEMQDSYQKLLAAAVEKDSAVWAVHEYDHGSMRNFFINYDEIGHTCQDGSKAMACSGIEITRVYGEYTFNNGQSGHVYADVKDKKISCLQYWDTDSCNPVRSKEEDDARREALIREYLQHPPASQASSPDPQASQTPSPHPQTGGSGDPWGSALCNKAFGTSALNFMSPCN